MKLLLSILLFSFSVQLTAQKNQYELTIEVPGIKDSVGYLAYYHGKGQYYRDTAKVGKNGKIVFTSTTDSLEHGMYSFVLGNMKIFDFIVDGQKFSLKTDTAEVVTKMVVKGSPENKIFYEYMSFLGVRQDELKKLSKELQNANDSKKLKIEARQKELDEEVKAYIKLLHENHSGTLTSNFIKALSVPQVPEPPKNEDGSIDSSFSFRYYKNHFFDDLDFTDQRLLRTSVYHEKIMTYLNKLTYQIPDSIIKSVDVVLKNAIKNDELFKYTLNNLTSKYERSEQMGIDAVFVHLAKNYYMKGMADEWFSKEQLKKLSERANALEPLLIGKKAPNIVVKDTAQKKFLQLYEVESPFTIVYIWSPDCGHCKISTPELKKVYDEYKSKGVEVFGVNNEFENKDWIKFINKHQLDWINGSDGGDYRSNFRTLYDVYSTPQTYVLDKDKKIIAKKIPIESLGNVLDFYIKQAEKDKLKAIDEK
tara:strand:+ start:43884 stop:45317 length:1434 start_codon:yes stop_codon:yes gene_type:complete